MFSLSALGSCLAFASAKAGLVVVHISFIIHMVLVTVVASVVMLLFRCSVGECLCCSLCLLVLPMFAPFSLRGEGGFLAHCCRLLKLCLCRFMKVPPLLVLPFFEFALSYPSSLTTTLAC